MTTAQLISGFMRNLADTGSFPADERDHWLDVCCQPEFVEQMLVQIAQNYESHDEGMCKLLNIVDSHFAKELK